MIKANKKWLLIILAVIFIVNLSIRIISPLTLTNLDNEGIKTIIYSHYEQEFPSWPKPENQEEAKNHNITIKQILAREMIEYGINGKMLLVFHHDKQNSDTIKYTYIARPMFKWIVGSNWIEPLELMLEREPISASVSDIPNTPFLYGFINDPRVVRVLAGSERTTFKDATIIDFELTDGRKVKFYYLVPSADNNVIALDSAYNVIYQKVAAYGGY